MNPRPFLVGALILAGQFCALVPAADPPPVAPAVAEQLGLQQMRELPVVVVDTEGEPIANAKVIPWALRCSQGHGAWQIDDEEAGVGPQGVMTSAEGRANVAYPFFRNVKEQIRTISVSITVDHPDFAILGAEHINVPLEGDDPYRIELTRGGAVEVRPLIDGVLTTDNVHAIWSDSRAWEPGASAHRTPTGTLRIPAMKPGKNSLLLVKLDGDRATHFSGIVDFDLEPGPAKQLDVPLEPAARIAGRLSDSVPRPIKSGRIKLSTLNPMAGDYDRVSWFTWLPVQPDGAFVIENWPAHEPIQLLALCDGYIATSGEPPASVTNPYTGHVDPFQRPHVFYPASPGPIEVEMEPLLPFVVTAVDDEDQPIAGIHVMSSPNVCWWNHGSQLYCHPLVRGERWLQSRDYRAMYDEDFPQPFAAFTDGNGMATLQLPTGKDVLGIRSDVYELPIILGRRLIQIEATAGNTAVLQLRLQPVGTEKLGEWDKLAGVVFGCSTREGRRICALPHVQKKMDEFVTRMREAQDQRDPQLLSEAYTFVAEAFTSVGDLEEAERWRSKADEQADLARAAKPSNDAK